MLLRVLASCPFDPCPPNSNNILTVNDVSCVRAKSGEPVDPGSLDGPCAGDFAVIGVFDANFMIPKIFSRSCWVAG